MSPILANIDTHFLYPSMIHVDAARYRVTTVLGSCIAVCLYDTRLKIGGINHYMLPLWNGQGLASPKFGNVAIEKLIEGMLRLGASRTTMIAKVFGGANLSEGIMKIGSRNTQIAFDLLDKENITVVAQSVGGNLGRKIIYDTGTSEVMMKFIQKQVRDGQ